MPDFEATGWGMLLAPAKLPPDIAERISRESLAVLRSPEMMKFMAERASATFPQTPAEAAKFLTKEVAKWGAL